MLDSGWQAAGTPVLDLQGSTTTTTGRHSTRQLPPTGSGADGGARAHARSPLSPAIRRTLSEEEMEEALVEHQAELIMRQQRAHAARAPPRMHGMAWHGPLLCI